MQTNFLTLGSLFSGIGGFELGFERTGKIQTIWQVEIDEYCRRVLGSHWPTVSRYSDVREVGAHNLARVDILCGGFPCQDISNAGKRAGIDGERSGLWSEYARIIRELRPRYVVVENVAALLGRGMERGLGDLAACGYDAEWQSIRASDVGAPHRRERIWIVAYPASDLRGTPGDAGQESSNWHGPLLADTNCGRFAVQGESHETEWSDRISLAPFGGETVPDTTDKGLGRREQFEEVCEVSRHVAHAVQERRNGGGRESTGLGRNESADNGHILSHPMREGRDAERPVDTGSENRTGAFSLTSRSDWWATEPDVGRVAHGIPARVDRLRGLGNAIVPQIAEFIGQQIVRHAFAEAKVPA
jgi:DNA (cytosine-5)-methyltransferase 1